MRDKAKKINTIAWFMLLTVLSSAVVAKNDFLYRILWEQGSIMKHPDYFKELITRAAKAGYNTMIFCDYDLNTIEKQDQAYRNKYQDALNHAKKNNIQLAPWIFHQTFPAYENYNLAESLPVKGTKFVVSGSEARAVGDHDIGLKNGGFESFTGNTLSDWSLGHTAGSNIIDQVTKKSGTASLCIRNAPKGALIRQTINVKPYRAYEISAWFKTSGLKYAGNVKLFVEPHLLARYDRPFGTPKIWTTFSGTQNWRKSVTDFNSLKETSATVTLYLAPSGAQGGNIWVDDFEVREVGLYETLRGRTRPLVVKDAQGTITYEEDKDYIVDPKCNSMTADGYWYEGHLKIPQGSRIKDGQELCVDWFQYANVRTIIPASDFCLPETWATLRDNVSRVDALLGTASNAVYSKYSEYRLGGWSQNCECFNFQTGGQYLARILEGSECLLRRNGNGCRTIFSENDMYDPYFNGWDGPYATWMGGGYPPSRHGAYGGTYGSYEGLSNDIIIINWNTPFGPAYTDSSLMFFAGKDPKYPNVKTRQVLQTLDAGNANTWCNTLDRLEPKGLDGIVGVSFTDWFYGTYTHMEPVANAFHARGRWGTNPFPDTSCAIVTACDGFDPVGIRPLTQRVGLTRFGLKATPAAKGTFRLQFFVPQYQRATLEVFSLHGRRISTLLDEKRQVGTQRVTWNTSALPSGIYFLHLSIEGFGRRTLKQIVF